MSVAVLLSGQLRDWKLTWPTIKENIIDIYNADVFFCYGWEAPEIDEVEFVSTFNPTDYWYGNFPSHLTPTINGLETKDKHPETNVNSFVKGLWGIYQANVLKSKFEKQNGFKYNFVVRCRPDLYIEQPLELKRDGVNIPIGWDHRGGYNDTFAYGDSESMDWYANLYNRLWSFSNGLLKVHPETNLKHNLDSGTFPIWRFHFPIRLRDMELSQLEYRQK